MPEVLASALPDQPVLSTDGREIGIVHNLTIEPRTGSLDTLLIEPNGNEFDEVEKTEGGYIPIPAEAISGFDDHLMVEIEQ